MAVLALSWVTQGAVAGYPISGVARPVLVRQVTSLAGLSTGAAKSEPHEVPHAAASTPWRAAPHCQLSAGRQGVPGVHGAGCAHYTRVDECIYGVALTARPG